MSDGFMLLTVGGCSHGEHKGRSAAATEEEENGKDDDAIRPKRLCRIEKLVSRAICKVGRQESKERAQKSESTTKEQLVSRWRRRGQVRSQGALLSCYQPDVYMSHKIMPPFFHYKNREHRPGPRVKHAERKEIRGDGQISTSTSNTRQIETQLGFARQARRGTLLPV